MAILDCGISDLEMLESIEYDLDDIIKELMDEGILNFNNLIQDVLFKAQMELNEAWTEEKETIKTNIEEELDRFKNESIEENYDYENDNDYKELLNYYSMVENDEINPMENVTWYINYQDTHIYLSHYNFYRRWMDYVLDNIEDKLGFEFYDSME